MGEIIFITGTDTGVGKTVLTAFLLHHLRQKKIRALAMKPFCTGEQSDVEILQKLQPGELSNEEMNPYFFPEPIAPSVAAKMHNKKIYLDDVLGAISKIKSRCEVLLVEGAGGLMVPLGVDFTVRDLIARLRCRVILVARNQLGTINHTLLSANALQHIQIKELKIAMMEPEKRDFSSQSNHEVLNQTLRTHCFCVHFLGEKPANKTSVEKNYKKIKKTLAAILECD